MGILDVKTAVKKFQYVVFSRGRKLLFLPTKQRA